MSTGRNNRLAGQIGEFLVCAELGRLGSSRVPSLETSRPSLYLRRTNSAARFPFK
jgi:hypothetical protein